MQFRVAIVLTSLASTACLGLAYENPTAPSPVVATAPSPAIISAAVLYGTGNGAGRAFLVVHVADATGRGLGVPVTIAVSNGTVAAGPSVFGIPTETAVTIHSDSVLGNAQATIVGRGSVVVTLTAAPISATVSLSIP